MVSIFQQALYSTYRHLFFCSKGRHKELLIQKELFWYLHDVMSSFHLGMYPVDRGLWRRISEHNARIENKQVSFELSFLTKVGNYIKGTFIYVFTHFSVMNDSMHIVNFMREHRLAKRVDIKPVHRLLLDSSCLEVVLKWW